MLASGNTTINYDGVWWKLADFSETSSHDGTLMGAVTLDSSLAGHIPVDCLRAPAMAALPPSSMARLHICAMEYPWHLLPR